MPYSIRDIATALGAEAEGDLDITVSGAAEPALASASQLALAMDPKYAPGLSKGQAQAALLWLGGGWGGYGRWVIDGRGKMGEGAAIALFVTIGAGARIGARARIASHVSIAEGAVIGDDALILQGARIGARVKIGDRFICQPGAVIGADGFSFVTPEKSGVEEVRATLGHRDEIRKQSWSRIHSLGAVTLGDDVEIGANSVIDRGTIRDTLIGSGTKLDNLVHIGHNVQVGRDCLLCGQVGIAGSARIGDRVVLAGQCGVNDNIFVGDDVIAGGGTKIFTNAPAGRGLLGFPAVKMETHVELQKALRRLPRLATRVAALEKAQGEGDIPLSQDRD